MLYILVCLFVDIKARFMKGNDIIIFVRIDIQTQIFC